MNRAQGIASTFVTSAQDNTLEWIGVIIMLLLAFLIGGYYIQEKFIYRRRFQKTRNRPAANLREELQIKEWEPKTPTAQNRNVAKSPVQRTRR